jgi:hypothetical protein
MGLDQVRQASKVLGPLLRRRGTSVAGLLERPELLAHWNTYYAKANGRLKPGQWYYQGKPMLAAPRETSAPGSGARA